MKIDSASSGSLLSQMLRQSLAGSVSEELAKAGVQAPASTGLASAQAAPLSSSSMMSRNFFNANYERSQYVQSSIDGLRVEGSYADKMGSLVTSLAAQTALWDIKRKFGGDEPLEDTYVNAARLGATSARAVDRIRQEETAERSRDNLDQIKEDLEDRTAQAVDAPSIAAEVEPPAINAHAEAVDIAPAPVAADAVMPVANAAAGALPVYFAQAALTPAPLSPSTPSLDLTV